LWQVERGTEGREEKSRWGDILFDEKSEKKEIKNLVLKSKSGPSLTSPKGEKPRREDTEIEVTYFCEKLPQGEVPGSLDGERSRATTPQDEDCKAFQS